VRTDRKAKPAFARPPEQGRLEHVLITLRRAAGTGLNASVRIATDLHWEQDFAALPRDLADGQAEFLKGFLHGVRRDFPRR
jgi:hypothetical protein